MGSTIAILYRSPGCYLLISCLSRLFSSHSRKPATSNGRSILQSIARIVDISINALQLHLSMCLFPQLAVPLGMITATISKWRSILQSRLGSLTSRSTLFNGTSPCVRFFASQFSLPVFRISKQDCHNSCRGTAFLI
jgi:hypothetical protein